MGYLFFLFLFRCTVPKKKVVVKRKKLKRKMVLSPQRQGNVTSVVALPRKPPRDKKAVLKSKIQDILNGLSRFVIRKPSSAGSSKEKDLSSRGQDSSNTQGNQKEPSPSTVSKKSKEVKQHRCCPHMRVRFFFCFFSTSPVFLSEDICVTSPS